MAAEAEAQASVYARSPPQNSVLLEQTATRARALGHCKGVKSGKG